MTKTFYIPLKYTNKTITMLCAFKKMKSNFMVQYMEIMWGKLKNNVLYAQKENIIKYNLKTIFL